MGNHRRNHAVTRTEQKKKKEKKRVGMNAGKIPKKGTEKEINSGKRQKKSQPSNPKKSNSGTGGRKSVQYKEGGHGRQRKKGQVKGPHSRKQAKNNVVRTMPLGAGGRGRR